MNPSFLGVITVISPIYWGFFKPSFFHWFLGFQGFLIFRSRQLDMDGSGCVVVRRHTVDPPFLRVWSKTWCFYLGGKIPD